MSWSRRDGPRPRPTEARLVEGVLDAQARPNRCGGTVSQRIGSTTSSRLSDAAARRSTTIALLRTRTSSRPRLRSRSSRRRSPPNARGAGSNILCSRTILLGRRARDWDGAFSTAVLFSIRRANLAAHADVRAAARRRVNSLRLRLRLRLVTSQGSPYPSRSPRAHPSGWTSLC